MYIEIQILLTGFYIFLYSVSWENFLQHQNNLIAFPFGCILIFKGEIWYWSLLGHERQVKQKSDDSFPSTCKQLEGWYFKQMKIIAVLNLSSWGKSKPEKNSGSNGIRTHDLCDALVSQTEVMGLNPVQAWIFFFRLAFSSTVSSLLWWSSFA